MSFRITIQPSGRTFDVAAGQNVLAAALATGIVLPYGCKNGACGSCKAHIVDGLWHQGPHAASALTADEASNGKALLCCSQPLSDLVVEARELAGVGDIPVRKMPCRIGRIDRPAPDVAVVTIQLPAHERLQFRAGQFLEFILADGSRRSYSIATAPHAIEQGIELHIRHMPGGAFTDALFGVLPGAEQPAKEPTMKERSLLRFEGPLGTFFLREVESKPIVLLASGTGFAPIKAIAEHMFFRRLNRADGARAARPIVLYWGCRSGRDLYRDALARQWADEEPNFHYVPVLSEPSAADGWTGRTGFVHRAVMADLPDLSGHQVYACGAPIMVDSARHDFIERCGLPEDEFFADSFTSQADVVD